MARWKMNPVQGINLVQYEEPDPEPLLALYLPSGTKVTPAEAVNLASALLQWATQNRGH